MASRYHVCQFSGKTDNFDFFGPNLTKNEFWGWIFKNLSPDSESSLPKYHVYWFSGKTDKFEFFALNLGKLPNYVQYFGSHNVEGVAESWVEAEMSWVELVGDGWRWIELGARFSNTHLETKIYKRLTTESIVLDKAST